MPIARFQMPDGKIGRFEVPEGTTPDQAQAMIAQALGTAQEPARADGGIAQPVGYLGGLTKSLNPFGLGDEVAAAGQTVGDYIGSAMTGQKFPGWGAAYDQNLANERATIDAFRQQNPVAGTMSAIAGSMGRPGEAATQMLARAPSAWGAAKEGAKIGAGYGGALGFTEGEGGAADRVKAATGGAAVGGLLGAGAPVVVEGISASLRKAAQGVLDRLGPESQAAQRIARALQRDNMTVDDLRTVLDNLGPNATLADAGGANLRGLAEVVAQTPGEGMQAAQVLQQRMEGQGNRLSDAVNRGLSGADVVQTADQLAAKRASDAAPLYEAANATGPVHSDRIAEFLSDPIAKAGLRQGIEIQRLEALAAGKPFNPNDLAVVGFNDAGDPILGGVPNMRTIDAVKKGLDNILDQYRDPMSGRLVLDQRGRAVDAVRRSFLGEVDAANPIYAEARAAWAGPSQSLDAMAAGRDFTKLDPRVLRQQMQGMSPSDAEFYRAGVADRVKEMISTTRDGADSTRKIFGNDRIREQLRAVFPDDASFNAFAQDVEREALFARTRNQMLRGSQTYMRQAAAADMAAPSVSDVLGSAVQGNYGAAFGQGVRSLANMLLRPPQGVTSELAPMLFSQGDNAATLAALTQKADALSLSAAQRRSLARMLSEGVGMGAGNLAANQSQRP